MAQDRSSTDSITAYQLDLVIEAVDQRFGKGFALQNPALVGDCMKAAAVNRLTTKICEVIRGAGNNRSEET